MFGYTDVPSGKAFVGCHHAWKKFLGSPEDIFGIVLADSFNSRFFQTGPVQETGRFVLPVDTRWLFVFVTQSWSVWRLVNGVCPSFFEPCHGHPGWWKPILPADSCWCSLLTRQPRYVVEDQEHGYLDAYDIYITNKHNKGLKAVGLWEVHHRLSFWCSSLQFETFYPKISKVC